MMHTLPKRVSRNAHQHRARAAFEGARDLVSGESNYMEAHTDGCLTYMYIHIHHFATV